MSKNLLILGAGQYGSVVCEAVEALGEYDRIEFLDDNRENVFGRIEDLEKYISDFSYVVVAIGYNETRMNLIDRAKKAGFIIPCIIHPKSYVSPSAKLGEGCIVEPFAVIQSNAVVGKGCIISSTAIVNHNAFLEDGAHCDCASIISARAVVPRNHKVKYGEVFYASSQDKGEIKYPVGYSAENGV